MPSQQNYNLEDSWVTYISLLGDSPLYIQLLHAKVGRVWCNPNNKSWVIGFVWLAWVALWPMLDSGLLYARERSHLSLIHLFTTHNIPRTFHVKFLSNSGPTQKTLVGWVRANSKGCSWTEAKLRSSSGYAKTSLSWPKPAESKLDPQGQTQEVSTEAWSIAP